MRGKVLYNAEHNGIEIYFDQKPDAEVFEALKAAGFRFHRQKRCLFAKVTPERERLALQYGDSETEAQPEHEPTAESAWMPGYDTVDGLPIYPDSNQVEIDTTGGYFADINACIRIKFDITITDLEYALMPGKQCPQVAVSSDDNGTARPAAQDLMTFRELYEKYYTRREAPGEGFRMYERQQESMRTFSPFKRVSPIKMPKKWTIPHVWKAILSGQIYLGTVDGRYSDDYAFDASVGFYTGRSLHLPTFAKELIESPGGWYAHPDSSSGNAATLSVNCHTFDCNTLHFDESCDWAEAQRRREAVTAEVTGHNTELEKQILAVDPASIIPTVPYDISYLEMDDNTNRYEVKTATVLGLELSEGGYGFMPVISMAPHTAENAAFYVISDFHRRPYYEDDPRLIDMGNWKTIVTGKALIDLAAEGWHFAVIYRETNESFQTYRDEIEAFLQGDRFFAFGPKIDYRQSLARLNAQHGQASE